MTFHSLALQWAVVAMTTGIIVGCGQNGEQPVSLSESPPAVAGESGSHDHAHPTEGPHGGDLIELGNEEYHAELLHPHDHDADAHPKQEKGAGVHKDGDHEHAGLSVFILDGSAKDVVPIAATEITLNLRHDGKPKQFKLAAMPTDKDPKGKSSRFTSDDKDLLEHFHQEAIDGTLVITIDGKQYRGKVAHDHEHDHGHKDKHDH